MKKLFAIIFSILISPQLTFACDQPSCWSDRDKELQYLNWMIYEHIALGLIVGIILSLITVKLMRKANKKSSNK